MKEKYIIAVIILILLGGCVSNGFRITKKAGEVFLFSGRLVDGETNLPIPDAEIEIFTWYQPAFSVMSYKKLGNVETNEMGRFAFATHELELIVVVDGCVAFNDYGAEPFDPREHQEFILKKKSSNSAIGLKETQIKYIERRGEGNG